MLSRTARSTSLRLAGTACTASVASTSASSAVSATSMSPGKKAYPVQKSEDEWRKQLGPKVYRILRQQGTEPPRSHEYDKAAPKQGVFRCAGCNHPLYTANAKFRSSCGWPCFDQVIYSKEHGCHVGTQSDGGGIEIICNNCGGHLGHVFYGEGCTPNDERH
eukprot:gnl/TRDRNA2_/TRDRNA2_183658_c0_seq1.p2 gnl/TRDRNA2_/TRDRNA2_183658_c0~~gnl/TRDRNA2_/TRDRNA2_183658_c0_seq1.p2  ORF type:complete len:162 (-),score=13.36 gnl/TRDRNA2_/TRDRNA2_183658_c0_seq1:574-1059(-)